MLSQGDCRAAERWLVLSNCQTHGFANSLQVLAPHAKVVPLYAHTFNKKPSFYNKLIRDFDRLFISKGMEKFTPKANFDQIPCHIHLPWFGFRAYHPDLIYLQDTNGAKIKGPADDYHSALIFAAYVKGLSQSDTRLLFRRNIFEACGFLDCWEPERERIVAHVAESGIDISGMLRFWGKDDAFMYSINHPKIRVLFGIARKITENLGIEAPRGALLPADNLAFASGFAVYPEIGENLGVEGSYLFKTYDSYRQFGLEEYIAGCFQVYAQYPDGQIKPSAEFSSIVEKAHSVI